MQSIYPVSHSFRLSPLQLNCFLFSFEENNLTDGIFDQLSKLNLDQLKSLNLARNKFTSTGLRKLFEQNAMVK